MCGRIEDAITHNQYVAVNYLLEKLTPETRILYVFYFMQVLSHCEIKHKC